MLKVTGKIHLKYKMITGVSAKGAYRLIEFVVYKQYNGDKIPLLFVAHGNMADKVEAMPMKKKVVIQFLPKCTEKNGKWYTDLKVLDIQDWTKKEPYNNQVLFSETQPDTRTIAEVNPNEISSAGQQLSFSGERDALDEAMERSSRESKKDKIASPASQDLPFPETEEVEATMPSAPPLSREALIEKGKNAGIKGKTKGKKNSPF